jgi:nitroreductase
VSYVDVYEAIEKRKSVRAYESKPVAKEVLVKLLEAARIAPSAGNVQPWHFIVVTDSEKRKVLSKGAFAKFLNEAPAVIVACGDTKVSSEWYAVDTSLALENIALAAVGEGLGTCFVGSFKEENVKAALKIPQNFSVIAMLAVGYSADREGLGTKILRAIRKRKKMQDISSAEMYGQPFAESQ